MAQRRFELAGPLAQGAGADLGGDTFQRMRQQLRFAAVVGLQGCRDASSKVDLAGHETAQQGEIQRVAPHRLAQSGRGIETGNVGQAARREDRGSGTGRDHRGGAGRSAARTDPALQLAPQVVRVDRLGDVVVHAGVDAAFAIAAHRVGGHRDDGQFTPVRQAADRAGRRDAVHDRHLHVHEHDVVIVGRRLRHHVERDGAVGGKFNNETGLAEQFGGDLLVQIVVLDKQDAAADDPAQVDAGRRGCEHETALARAAAQDAHDSIEKQRGSDRFDQDILEAGLAGRLHDLVAPKGSDHDQARRILRQGLADLARRHQAVHDRHLPVEENDLVGPVDRCGADDFRHRLGTARRSADIEQHGTQQVADDIARRVVVVDHQHAAVAQVGIGLQAARLFLAAPETGGKPEIRAASRRAVHTDLTAHQFGQLPRNGEAETGAAELARRRTVGLLETLEEAAALLRINADPAIDHREMQQQIAFAFLHDADVDGDLALLGEFDGIVGVIDQHLAEAQGIADQCPRHARADVDDQLQALGRRLFRDQPGDVLEHPVELELDVFDDHLARLDLREVENVVDDAEQMLARALDLVQVIALARRQLGFHGQVRHADDGIHRRPDLVTHIGQKIGFHARRRFGQLTRRLHLRERGLLHRNILDHPDRALGTFCDIDRRPGQAGPEQAAVVAHQLLLAAMHLAAPDLLVHLAAARGFSRRIGIPECGALPDHLPGRPAEHLMQAAVAAQDDAVTDQGDAGVGGIENRLLLLGREVQRLGGRPLGRNILDYADHALAEVGDIHGMPRHARPEAAAVLAHHLLFADMDLAAPDLTVNFLTGRRPGCIVDIPDARRLADLLTFAVTEHLVHAPVAAHDAPLAHKHDTGAGRVEQGVLFAERGIELGGTAGDQRFKMLAMALEFVAHLFLERDVFLDRDVMRDLTVRLAQGHDDRRLDLLAAVLGLVEENAFPGIALIEGLPHLAVSGGRRVAGLEQTRRLADRLGAAVAGVAGERVVDVFDAAVEIGDDDRIRALFDGQRQLANLRCGPLFLTDVAPDADQVIALVLANEPDADPDVDEFPVLAAMPVLKLAHPAGGSLRGNRGQLGGCLAGLDRGQRHADHLVAAVAQHLAARRIDLDKAQGFGIDQLDRIRRAGNHRIEQGLAVALGGSDAAPLDGTAEMTGDRFEQAALLVEERRTGIGRQGRVIDDGDPARLPPRPDKTDRQFGAARRRTVEAPAAFDTSARQFGKTHRTGQALDDDGEHGIQLEILAMRDPRHLEQAGQFLHPLIEFGP